MVRLNSLLVMASGVYDSHKAVLDKLVAGLDSLIFSGMDARDAEDFFERAGKTEVASFEQLAAEHPAPVDVVNALRNAYQGSLNIYKDRKARGIRS